MFHVEHFRLKGMFKEYDVIVVGAGHAGSAVGSFAVCGGHSCLSRVCQFVGIRRSTGTNWLQLKQSGYKTSAIGILTSRPGCLVGVQSAAGTYM